jgi:hypothetical protein
MWHRWIGVGLGAAGLAFAATANTATAGQTGAGFGLRENSLGLPPPADTGKPALTLPPPGVLDRAPGGCLRVLPCGTRLLGTVRRDGAIELNVPAWRW